MASMNFCPYPVEPWKLIMMTTYPFAANSSGFQRKLQSSPQAPCGPPWMRNFTGYFLPASKFGGLTREPSTLSPCAPRNENDSAFDMPICDSNCSFTWVSAQSLFNEQFSFPRSTSPVLAGQPSPAPSAEEISFGALIDMRLNTNSFPSGVMVTSSSKPPTSARLGNSIWFLSVPEDTPTA